MQIIAATSQGDKSYKRSKLCAFHYSLGGAESASKDGLVEELAHLQLNGKRLISHPLSHSLTPILPKLLHFYISDFYFSFNSLRVETKNNS